MRQARILELLSEGLISDLEAHVELGLEYQREGYEELSGTKFFKAGASKAQAEKASPNNDPQGAALQPKTPKKAGGSSQ